MIPISNNNTVEHRIITTHQQPATIKPLEGIIEGYPIVFNQRTAISDLFFEEIDPHALDNADLSDIKFLVNHDDAMIPLARHRRGKRCTMEVDIDEKGMLICAHTDIENNTVAKAVCSAVQRGDIEDMSFAFGIIVTGEEWSDLDEDMPSRRITQIRKVFEVSAVNDGAYPQTSISARTASLENEKRALDNARAVALENEKRAREQKAQAALMLEKQKYLYLEELKNDN